MAIATLLITTMILKATGTIGMPGMVASIAIGSVICIIAAIAGDTSQDLKTGYLVGATPWKQQVGEIIGVAASAIAIGGVLYLLNAAWSYGSSAIPAPQATLMKMVVEGVMGGNLPWVLVFACLLYTSSRFTSDCTIADHSDTGDKQGNLRYFLVLQDIVAPFNC